MPYSIQKQRGGGFKVVEGGHSFSKRPLTKVQAQRQRVAIALSEARRTGKPAGAFFA